MKRKSRMRALVGSFTLVCALAIMAAPAFAGATYYCGWSIKPDTWCASKGMAGVTHNSATNLSSGSARVGIRLVNGGSIYNRYFATNYVAHSSSAIYSNPQVANGSSVNKSIRGYTQWSSGGPITASYLNVSQRLSRSRAARKLRATATSDPQLGPDGATYSWSLGKNATCIARTFMGEYAESCSPNSKTSASPVVTQDLTIDLDRGYVRVFGVAPFGASVVKVAAPGRGGTIVPVVNRVFVATFSGAATEAVTVTTANQ